MSIRYSSAILRLCLLAAACSAKQALAQQVDGYIAPSSSGGSSLTIVNGTYPAGLGEPLNVILSNRSDAAVLVDSLDNGGFQNWALSINFGAECGTVQVNDNSTVGHKADLGDGQGQQEEIATLRENFGDTSFGTCLETLNGGNHFRYYKQAESGALFLEASTEMDLSNQHDIVPNGYNLGRDHIVGVACSNTSIPTTTLANGSTFSGSSSYNGWTYDHSVVYVAGLLSNSSDGVNHAGTVATEGQPAIDGLTAIVTVTISQQGSSTSSGGGTAASPSVTSFSGARSSKDGSQYSALVATTSTVLFAFAALACGLAA